MLAQWLTDLAGSPAELLVLPVANASILIKKPPLPVRRVEHCQNRAGLRSHLKFVPCVHTNQTLTLLLFFPKHDPQAWSLYLGKK